MKKVKFFMVMSLIITSSLLLFSGCDKKNRLHMDADKCAEAALEYLEEKYQTEFEVLRSSEQRKYIGSAGYAEVIVSEKNGNEEDRYAVIVYPDGSSDEDKDGYYDSYKIVSDTYMCYLLQDYAKNDLDKLLMEAGLTRFVSSVSIEEVGGIEGFSGFAAEFTVQSEESFSLKDILDNYKIIIIYWIEIPESEYSEMLQTNITNIMRPLVSDDLISLDIEVYSEETYKEREQLLIHDRTNILRGIASINFSITEEEDKNEFK